MEIVISFCFARWIPRVDGAAFFSTRSDSDLHYKRHELFFVVVCIFSVLFVYFTCTSIFCPSSLTSLTYFFYFAIPLSICHATMYVREHWVARICLQQSASLKSHGFIHIDSKNFSVYIIRMKMLPNPHTHKHTHLRTKREKKSQSCFLGINCLISKGFMPLSVGCTDIWSRLSVWCVVFLSVEHCFHSYAPLTFYCEFLLNICILAS